MAFAICILLTVSSWSWRYVPGWRWVVAATGAAVLGFVLVQNQTQNIETVLLKNRVWNAEISGTIESFERAGSGWRIVLEQAQIASKPENYVLRLSVRQKDFHPQIGGKVVVRASLMPPSPPLVPGSYDFRRHAFFDGVSGYGYTTKILSNIPPQEVQKKNDLEHYRDWLTERVYVVLKQPEAGIVTALLNGQRAGISHATTQVLQKSGLQHVISISGLHVGLLAMTVFFLSRFLMALSMNLALHYPIKKIAAFLALLSIIFYLMIVGSSPPTLRSVIMTGIALVAVMLDREPIQLRVVAISALFILLQQPDSLVDIGFQMSFVAVIGLVAFFQATRSFWSHSTWQNSIFLKVARALLVVLVTSLIATIVTAPLVLLYFQQIPLLSMLANLLAMPPITFLIMPGTFLAYLFTPVPVLGDWAILMMGWGVKMMMAIAYFVADMPSAVLQLPSLSLPVVCLVLMGLFALIVIKNQSRWLGILPIVIGCALIPFSRQPDFLIMQNRVILQPDPKSDTLFFEGRLGGFEKNMMLQATGKKQAAPFPCDKDICDLHLKGKTIRLIRTVPALEQACQGKADMVLTHYYLDWHLRKGCGRARVIDRHALKRYGGHALYLGKDIRIEKVLTGKSKRLWQ